MDLAGAVVVAVGQEVVALAAEWAVASGAVQAEVVSVVEGVWAEPRLSAGEVCIWMEDVFSVNIL